MNELLNEFWQYLKMTPEEYSMCSMNQDLEEYFFPRWEEIKNIAYSLIDSEKMDSESLDMVLLIMALDNEEEYITDYLTEEGRNNEYIMEISGNSGNCSDKYIEKLSERAIRFPQPHARWQVAEVLRRRRTKNTLSILEKLLSDENAYVRHRAKYSYLDIIWGENTDKLC